MAAAAAVVRHIYSLLDACCTPHQLPAVHAVLLSSGLHFSHSLSSKFILLASSLGRGHLPHGRHLFDKIPHPNAFLYNTLIKSYSNHNSFSSSLECYAHMLRRGIVPDGFTLPPVLKACGALHSLVLGRAVHAHVLRLGFGLDLFILNGLIAMYSKCGAIDDACELFDELTERDVISWTSVISGCAQNGMPLRALRIFDEMRRAADNVRPDFVSLVSVLKAYADVEDLAQGQSVHALVVKAGFEDEADIVITLTAMYAKCGQVLVARSLFDQVSMPDVILWNAMISGYANNGYAHEAVELFRRMIQRDLKPNSISIRSAISACAQIGSLGIGRWMEEYVAKTEFRDDVFVNTALIDMYAKCGSIARAREVFDRVPLKDVVLWSAIIVGYALHGHAREAIRLFGEMQHARVSPNYVTFIGLLSACNHAGLVEEGKKYFLAMRALGIEPRHQHYACIVDLLSRAGRLGEAYEFITSMPIDPGISIWGALLHACKIHGNVELGEIAAHQIFSIDPCNAGHYVQLSNIYASAGMWGEVAKVRVMMMERGVAKDTGCSLVEINGKLQAFHVGDETCWRRSQEVLEMLDELEKKMRESAFVSETTEHDAYVLGVESLTVQHNVIKL